MTGSIKSDFDDAQDNTEETALVFVFLAVSYKLRKLHDCFVEEVTVSQSGCGEMSANKLKTFAPDLGPRQINARQ